MSIVSRLLFYVGTVVFLTVGGFLANLIGTAIGTALMAFGLLPKAIHDPDPLHPFPFHRSIALPCLVTNFALLCICNALWLRFAHETLPFGCVLLWAFTALLQASNENANYANRLYTVAGLWGALVFFVYALIRRGFTNANWF